MKTVCPSCGAVGNVPEDRLPETGANIRCPSCSTIFFVSRDGSASVATSPSAAAEAESGSHPASGARPTSVRSGRTSTEVPAAPRAALRQRAWKIKIPGGMVYDFSDSDTARKWLESRSSLEGITLSEDAGASWSAPSEIDDMCDVRPKGITASRRTGPHSAFQTGEVSARSGSGASRRTSFTGAHEAAAQRADGGRSGASSKVPASGAVRRTRPSHTTGAVRSKEMGRKKAQKDGPDMGRMIGLVVVMLLCVAGAAYYFGAAAAPDELPATPAGEKAAWVLQQMNGGAASLTPTQIQQNVASSALSRMSAEDLISGLQFYDERSAGYDFQQVVSEQSDYRFSFQVLTSIGYTATIDLEVEPAPPHKISQLNFQLDE